MRQVSLLTEQLEESNGGGFCEGGGTVALLSLPAAKPSLNESRAVAIPKTRLLYKCNRFAQVVQQTAQLSNFLQPKVEVVWHVAPTRCGQDYLQDSLI